MMCSEEDYSLDEIADILQQELSINADRITRLPYPFRADWVVYLMQQIEAYGGQDDDILSYIRDAITTRLNNGVW
jgi:hypothetical protein